MNIYDAIEEMAEIFDYLCGLGVSEELGKRMSDVEDAIRGFVDDVFETNNSYDEEDYE